MRMWWWRVKRADYWWHLIARHLPRSLQYWCAIRVGAHATRGRYGSTVVPELRFTEALERWRK